MNALVRAERRIRRNRRAWEPLVGPAALLGPPLLALLALRWTRPVLLGFEGAGEAVFRDGLEGVFVRLGFLVSGAGLLAAHGAALRPGDRPVLDLLPLDPALLRPVILGRVARATAGPALACAVLLLPLGWGGRPLALVAGVVVLLGAWLAAAPLGCLGALGGVLAARSPRWSAFLELLRGSSPPMQAALIWVPGLAFAAAAGAVLAAAHGGAALAVGHPSGAVGLVAPFVVAGAGRVLLGPVLDRGWYASTVVLAEVDAAWARVQGIEDRLRVHLEWTVRFFPPPLRIHALRTFRHAWRGLRVWVTGAWGLGFVGAVAGWSGEAEAPRRALAVAAAAVGLLGALGLRLETLDPPWLGRAIGLPLLPRLAARAGAVGLLLQGAVLPVVLAMLVRHGAQALPLFAALEATIAVCALVGAAAGPMRRASLVAYVPLATGAWILATRCLP